MKSKTKVFAAAIAILIISLILVATYLQTPKNNKGPLDLTRVACVGDSITQITNYPNHLQTLLGANSTVGNFGDSGATVIFTSVRPYIFQIAFQRAIEFQPTTVVIMLGTNDARADVYSNISSFVDDYKLLISEFRSLKSKPQIFLAKPPPVYSGAINTSSTDFSEGIIPCIEQVAKETGLTLVDVNTPLINRPEYFMDGLHPNNKGAKIIADIIYQEITSGEHKNK